MPPTTTGEYKEGEVDVEVVMEVEKLLPGGDGFVFRETEPIEIAAYVLVPGIFPTFRPHIFFLPSG